MRLDPPTDKPALSLLSMYFLESARTLVKPTEFPLPPFGLSAREIECLQFVAHGRSDREIAQALFIAASTAHGHVESAKRRLGCSTRAEAVAHALAYRVIHDG